MENGKKKVQLRTVAELAQECYLNALKQKEQLLIQKKQLMDQRKQLLDHELDLQEQLLDVQERIVAEESVF